MRKNENQRETYITALYLSKFDKRAVTELGCKNWHEAFIKIAKALDTKPATIKNNRDYFDTFFPNKRQGWHKVKPYKIVRDIYYEFGNCDFTTMTLCVKKILANNAVLNQEINAQKELKQQEKSEEEKKYVLDLWEHEGGDREVSIIDYESGFLVGIADLITEKEVIEVKDIKNWKHAVGQAFAYWYYFSAYPNSVNKQLIPRIHLFGGDGVDDYRIQLCESLMKTVFSPHTHSIRVTYAEDFDDLIVDFE